jgi:hypothetical protein
MRIIAVGILSLMLYSCAQQEPGNVAVAGAGTTSIQWLDSVKNLGTLTEGAKVEVSFRFRNSGDRPLVINGVTASCGCTVPEKPAEPVAPGEEGSIKAVFDSKGRTGMNHKTVTVYANTEQPMHPLVFEVEVVPVQ